ncbi:MAG: superoxide dismutase [Bacteroidota bacterium]
MRILATEQEIPGVDPEAFAAHLKAEARAVLSLYERGIIREIFFTRDTHEAVVFLECSSEEEARRHLAELPLVREGLITFKVIVLLPYDGFSRLLH